MLNILLSIIFLHLRKYCILMFELKKNVLKSSLSIKFCHLVGTTLMQFTSSRLPEKQVLPSE